MKRRGQQAGFGTVAILLVVFVVAAVAVAGIVVYQRHKGTTTKSTASTNPSQSTPHQQNTTPAQPAPDTTQYLTIKEWGIRAKADSTYTLKYKIWPSNQNVANFTSDQLTAASSNPQCGIAAASGGTEKFPGYYGGGYIARLLPSDTVYGLPADDSAESPAQYAALSQDQMGGGAIVKVGSYYYVYHPNQGPCADVGNVQNDTQAAAKKLLQSFQPTQNR